MAAAFDLFAESGYERATVKEISRRVGVGHPNLYHYFPSKSDIFNTVLMKGLDQLQEFYRATLEQHEDPIECLDGLLDLNRVHTSPMRRAFRIVIEHAGRDQSTVDKSIERAVREFYTYEIELFAAVVEHGVAMAVFQCDDTLAMGRFISRNLDGLYFGSVIRRDVSIPRGIRELRTQLLRLLGVEDEA